MLVGDAAGLADPFTGEGIRLAIKSGRLAAQAILSGHPEQYPTMVDQEIGVSQTFALRLSWFFYHFPGLCFTFGASNPFSTQAFTDLLADRAGYPMVILRLFASLPLYWLTAGIAQWKRRFGGTERRSPFPTAVK